MIFFILISSVFSFNISNALWPSRTATVMFTSSMGATNSQQLKDDLDANGTKDWIDEAKKGFSRWLAVNGVDFTITYSDDDCGVSCKLGNKKNEIYWVDPDTFTYTYPDKALGITFRYQDNYKWTEADIVINKNFDIALNPGDQNSSHRGFCVLDSSLGGGPYTGCYDFPSVITHEIGHFIGLEHPSEDPNLKDSDYRKQQTMYYSVDYNDSLLPLHSDDINGIYCLYPEGENSLSVEECCENQNPLLRPKMCSHNFSSSLSTSLTTKDTGGCGTLQNVSDFNKKEVFFIFFLIFSPIFLLIFLRGLSWH